MHLSHYEDPQWLAKLVSHNSFSHIQEEPDMYQICRRRA